MRVKGISEQVPTCFTFRYKLFQRTLTLSGGGGGGGGGGVGKCPRRFQSSRTSLLFKQYLRNFALLLKFIGEQDSIKTFCQGYHMVTRFSTPCLVKF